MSVIVEDWGQFIEIEFYETYNNVPEVIKYNNVYIIKHNNKNKNNKIIPINLDTNESKYKDEYEFKDDYKNDYNYEYLNNYYNIENDDDVNEIIDKNNIESKNRENENINKNENINENREIKNLMLSLSNINIINTFYNYKRYLILFISISFIIFSPLCLMKIEF